MQFFPLMLKSNFGVTSNHTQVAYSTDCPMLIHIHFFVSSTNSLHQQKPKTKNREGSKSVSENMESTIAGAGTSAVCPWDDAPTAVSVSVCPWDDEDPPSTSTSKQPVRYGTLIILVDPNMLERRLFFICPKAGRAIIQHSIRVVRHRTSAKYPIE